ncbi:gamma-glutamylcyclotransferase family protein, partial [Sulfoacidibacillus thermotolerans]
MRVFVYGTLLTGEGNHRVIAPYVHSICEGRIEGALYNSGPFPYLDVNGNGVVKGEWVTIKKGMEEKALLDLDRLEGYRGEGQMNLYDRVLVPDVNLPEIFGYVYTWPTEKSKKQLLAYPKIASGDWRKRHQETKKIAKKIDQLYFAYGSCMNAKS